MIEQDLLGISVNELVKNYCVLYDERENKPVGITTVKTAEKIDNTYGNDYEKRYVFVDIFATDYDSIKENKILSYYEVQKILEKYIGWVADPRDAYTLAIFLHSQWVEMSKDAASMLIDLIKIIKQFETLISSDDFTTINTIRSQIDNWQKQWCHYEMVNDDLLKEEHLKEANKILKEIHDREMKK